MMPKKPNAKGPAKSKKTKADPILGIIGGNKATKNPAKTISKKETGSKPKNENKVGEAIPSNTEISHKKVFGCSSDPILKQQKTEIPKINKLKPLAGLNINNPSQKFQFLQDEHENDVRMKLILSQVDKLMIQEKFNPKELREKGIYLGRFVTRLGKRDTDPISQEDLYLEHLNQKYYETIRESPESAFDREAKDEPAEEEEEEEENQKDDAEQKRVRFVLSEVVKSDPKKILFVKNGVLGIQGSALDDSNTLIIAEDIFHLTYDHKSCQKIGEETTIEEGEVKKDPEQVPVVPENQMEIEPEAHPEVKEEKKPENSAPVTKKEVQRVLITNAKQFKSMLPSIMKEFKDSVDLETSSCLSLFNSIILYGPILTEKDADQSDEIAEVEFLRIMEGIDNAIAVEKEKSKNSNFPSVIIIPSLEDFVHFFVFPQPSFNPEHIKGRVNDKPKEFKNLIFYPNPSLFELKTKKTSKTEAESENFVIGCCPDLSKMVPLLENNLYYGHNELPSYTKAIKAILRYQSWFPVFKSFDNLPFDHSLAIDSINIPQKPNLIIAPGLYKHPIEKSRYKNNSFFDEKIFTEDHVLVLDPKISDHFSVVEKATSEGTKISAQINVFKCECPK